MTARELARRPARPPAMSTELLLSAQRRYEQGASVHGIARDLGVNRSTLNYHVVRRGWQRRAPHLVEGDGRNGICPGIGLCPVRDFAHRRLHAALLTRIDRAEARGEEASAADRERDVRSLGAMVRTLEKLTGMDRDLVAAAAARGSTDGGTGDDVEALRAEAARLIENILAGGVRDEPA